jgi:hypothetical protein
MGAGSRRRARPAIRTAGRFSAISQTRGENSPVTTALFRVVLSVRPVRRFALLAGPLPQQRRQKKAPRASETGGGILWPARSSPTSAHARFVRLIGPCALSTPRAALSTPPRTVPRGNPRRSRRHNYFLVSHATECFSKHPLHAIRFGEESTTFYQEREKASIKNKATRLQRGASAAATDS